MKAYWTEPEQLDSKTRIVKKMLGEKKIGDNLQEQTGRWTFLKTITWYINGERVYQSA